MSSILVIGGAGFIGNSLTKRLCAEGFIVTVFDNLSNPSREFSREINLVQGDITEINDLRECIGNMKWDIVIHLAALHYIPECTKNPKKARQINITGTKNILECIKSLSPQTHIIFASSAAVYAPFPFACEETSEIAPVDIYGKTKIRGEDLLKEYSQSHGLNYTIFRLFNVYGTGDNTHHLIPVIVNQLKSSSEVKLGNIDTKRDYVYMDDVVDGFILVAKNTLLSRSKIFNLGTGKASSAKEIMDTIQSIFSQSNIRKDVNVFIEEKMIRRNDRPMLLANISEAKRVLKWSPKYDLRNGLSVLLTKEGLI